MELQLLPQPDDEDRRLGKILTTQLSEKKWTHFYAAIAFIKKSGVKHLHNELKDFANTKTVRITSGIDLAGTSIEGLQQLMNALNGFGNVWIFHNENGSTFHPKVYLFFNANEAILIIGSGNLTQGGIFTNYEASMAISLNLELKEEKRVFDDVKKTLDSWSINGGDCSKLLNDELLKELIDNGYIFPESMMSKRIAAVKAKTTSGTDGREKRKIFTSRKVPTAPSAKEHHIDLPDGVKMEGYAVIAPNPVKPKLGLNIVYLMTLQKTDVGSGQTTSGTSRRSPEIFIPISARNHNPEFWGWTNLFTEDSAKTGKFDRKNVPMIIGGAKINVNMMTWPDKSDFRLRNEVLRKSGNIGDILKLERAEVDLDYEYSIEIISQGSSNFAKYKLLCNTKVRGRSKKEWGYHTE